MAQDTAETISATITVTNSEACLISAMLTSGDKDTIATITDKLDPADFANTGADPVCVDTLIPGLLGRGKGSLLSCPVEVFRRSSNVMRLRCMRTIPMCR